MSFMKGFCVIVAAAALTGLASAETLNVQPSDNTSRFEHPGKPSRGMTQQRVEAKFGQPENRRSPVGDPPITRWEYADFVVFFEHDKVIHAVSRR